MQSKINEKGDCIWFWRTTVSGWALGVGIAADGEAFTEWLYWLITDQGVVAM